jgi:hypothetical protein
MTPLNSKQFLSINLTPVEVWLIQSSRRMLDFSENPAVVLLILLRDQFGVRRFGIASHCEEL